MPVKDHSSNVTRGTLVQPLSPAHPQTKTELQGEAGQRFTVYLVVQGGVNRSAIETHWSDCTVLLRVQYPFVLVFFIAFLEMACTWSLSIFRLILMDL